MSDLTGTPLLETQTNHRDLIHGKSNSLGPRSSFVSTNVFSQQSMNTKVKVETVDNERNLPHKCQHCPSETFIKTEPPDEISTSSYTYITPNISDTCENSPSYSQINVLKTEDDSYMSSNSNNYSVATSKTDEEISIETQKNVDNMISFKNEKELDTNIDSLQNCLNKDVRNNDSVQACLNKDTRYNDSVQACLNKETRNSDAVQVCLNKNVRGKDSAKPCLSKDIQKVVNVKLVPGEPDKISTLPPFTLRFCLQKDGKIGLSVVSTLNTNGSSGSVSSLNTDGSNDGTSSLNNIGSSSNGTVIRQGVDLSAVGQTLAYTNPLDSTPTPDKQSFVPSTATLTSQKTHLQGRFSSECVQGKMNCQDSACRNSNSFLMNLKTEENVASTSANDDTGELKKQKRSNMSTTPSTGKRKRRQKRKNGSTENTQDLSKVKKMRSMPLKQFISINPISEVNNASGNLNEGWILSNISDANSTRDNSFEIPNSSSNYQEFNNSLDNSFIKNELLQDLNVNVEPLTNLTSNCISLKNEPLEDEGLNCEPCVSLGSNCSSIQNKMLQNASLNFEQLVIFKDRSFNEEPPEEEITELPQSLDYLSPVLDQQPSSSSGISWFKVLLTGDLRPRNVQEMTKCMVRLERLDKNNKYKDLLKNGSYITQEDNKQTTSSTTERNILPQENNIQPAASTTERNMLPQEDNRQPTASTTERNILPLSDETKNQTDQKPKDSYIPKQEEDSDEEIVKAYYVCGICEERFDRSTVLTIHLRDKHHQERKHLGSKKNKDIKSKEDEEVVTLKQFKHLKEEASDGNRCTFCVEPTTFENVIELLQHTTKCHSVERDKIIAQRLIDLNIDKNQLQNPAYLKAEKAIVRNDVILLHPHSGKFICSLCDKTFWYAKFLQAHLLLDHIRNSSDFTLCGNYALAFEILTMSLRMNAPLQLVQEDIHSVVNKSYWIKQLNIYDDRFSKGRRITRQPIKECLLHDNEDLIVLEIERECDKGTELFEYVYGIQFWTCLICDTSHAFNQLKTHWKECHYKKENFYIYPQKNVNSQQHLQSNGTDSFFKLTDSDRKSLLIDNHASHDNGISVLHDVDSLPHSNVDSLDIVDSVPHGSVDSVDIVDSVPHGSVDLVDIVDSVPHGSVDSVDIVDSIPNGSVDSVDVVDSVDNVDSVTHGSVDSVPGDNLLPHDSDDVVPVDCGYTVSGENNIPENDLLGELNLHPIISLLNLSDSEKRSMELVIGNTISIYKSQLPLEKKFETCKEKMVSKDHNVMTYKIYMCDICLLEFESKKHFTSHMIAYHNKLYKQEKCDYFKTVEISRGQKLDPTLSGSLRKSKQKLKPKRADKIMKSVKTIECEICRQSFKGMWGLYLHFKKMHYSRLIGVVEQYVCNVCAKEFEDMVNYKFHLRYLHDINSYEKYICNLCGELNSSKMMLCEHTIQKHFDKSRQESFLKLCEYCGRLFPPQQHGNHVHEHHRKKSLKPHPYTDRLELKNSITCKLCAKVFTCKISYRHHIKKEHQPNTCHLCFKLFNNLTMHMYRVHGHTCNRNKILSD